MISSPCVTIAALGALLCTAQPPDDWGPPRHEPGHDQEVVWENFAPVPGMWLELPPTGLLAHIEGHVSFQMEGKRHGDGCNWRKVTKPVVVAVEVRVDGEPVLGTIRELNMTAADHYEVHDFGMYVPLPPGGSEIEVFARWADSTKPKCRVFFKPPQYHRLQALVWEARE